MISRPSIACSASGCATCMLVVIAGLALQIAIVHVDASSLALHSSRVNRQRYPFGLSSAACNEILKTIPRGGAKSITPLPPPVDEEAAAEADRAASVKSAFDPENPPSPPESQSQPAPPAATTAVEAAQAPPLTADHTKNLSAKLSNAWERTVPAVLMLAAATALLKFTGTAGLTVLIFALQIGMYHEATSVIEQFHINSDSDEYCLGAVPNDTKLLPAVDTSQLYHYDVRRHLTTGRIRPLQDPLWEVGEDEANPMFQVHGLRVDVGGSVAANGRTVSPVTLTLADGDGLLINARVGTPRTADALGLRKGHLIEPVELHRIHMSQHIESYSTAGIGLMKFAVVGCGPIPI
eukprot:CAMPEP_0178602416 /NCGR_PEP_ID=MMETSP0697-20121206/34951_1 /TAXON_ID=265572 /ORGANISM="Extubocellulus spinifer, Strain CCMP396" /LENGTH=350 /DNA_ID=CAMNT_0020240623 /DNA_START=6 /DNA_END=1058 /DNA_ORIENTATION=+